MIKCINKECSNYGLELEETVDVCPQCGSQTQNVKSNVKANIGFIAILVSLASILIFWQVNLYIGPALTVASIVVAFISKSKPAIIITILSLVAIAVLFFSVFADMLG